MDRKANGFWLEFVSGTGVPVENATPKFTTERTSPQFYSHSYEDSSGFFIWFEVTGADTWTTIELIDQNVIGHAITLSYPPEKISDEVLVAMVRALMAQFVAEVK